MRRARPRVDDRRVVELGQTALGAVQAHRRAAGVAGPQRAQGGERGGAGDQQRLANLVGRLQRRLGPLAELADATLVERARRQLERQRGAALGRRGGPHGEQPPAGVGVAAEQGLDPRAGHRELHRGADRRRARAPAGARRGCRRAVRRRPAPARAGPAARPGARGRRRAAAAAPPRTSARPRWARPRPPPRTGRRSPRCRRAGRSARRGGRAAQPPRRGARARAPPRSCAASRQTAGAASYTARRING